MEAYFKFKLFMEAVIPATIILVIILCALYACLRNCFRVSLMTKLGYEYKRGLGTNVAYEFQPHWVKGNIKIHYRKIDNLKYREIKKYVAKQEETK